MTTKRPLILGSLVAAIGIAFALLKDSSESLLTGVVRQEEYSTPERRQARRRQQNPAVTTITSVDEVEMLVIRSDGRASNDQDPERSSRGWRSLELTGCRSQVVSISEAAPFVIEENDIVAVWVDGGRVVSFERLLEMANRTRDRRVKVQLLFGVQAGFVVDLPGKPICGVDVVEELWLSNVCRMRITSETDSLGKFSVCGGDFRGLSWVPGYSTHRTPTLPGAKNVVESPTIVLPWVLRRHEIGVYRGDGETPAGQLEGLVSAGDGEHAFPFRVNEKGVGNIYLAGASSQVVVSLLNDDFCIVPSEEKSDKKIRHSAIVDVESGSVQKVSIVVSRRPQVQFFTSWDRGARAFPDVEFDVVGFSANIETKDHPGENGLRTQVLRLGSVRKRIATKSELPTRPIQMGCGWWHVAPVKQRFSLSKEFQPFRVANPFEKLIEKSNNALVVRRGTSFEVGPQGEYLRMFITPIPTAQKIELVLSCPSEVTGTVVETLTGQPVPDATVVATRYSSGGVTEPIAEVRTQSGGRFKFQGLQAGRWFLSVRAQGFPEHESEVFTIPFAPREREINVQLGSAALRVRFKGQAFLPGDFRIRVLRRRKPMLSLDPTLLAEASVDGDVCEIFPLAVGKIIIQVLPNNEDVSLKEGSIFERELTLANTVELVVTVGRSATQELKFVDVDGRSLPTIFVQLNGVKPNNPVSYFADDEGVISVKGVQGEMRTIDSILAMISTTIGENENFVGRLVLSSHSPKFRIGEADRLVLTVIPKED
ncbi:MAG: carboxypeptidase-like regulatory domain-containing protein [Planctomycetota bacterium]